MIIRLKVEGQRLEQNRLSCKRMVSHQVATKMAGKLSAVSKNEEPGFCPSAFPPPFVPSPQGRRTPLRGAAFEAWRSPFTAIR